MTAAAHELVLVVDFGSQVTQLIARRLREARVYCEIVPFQKVDGAFLHDRQPRAIILSGGPASVLDEGSPRAAPEVFLAGVPVLGICYGQQVMVEQLGGRVEGGGHREFGRAFLTGATPSPLFAQWISENSSEQVWMSHGDRVAELPDGFEIIGASPGAPFAAIADENRRFYGVQFHPEVLHTHRGKEQILRNFVFDIAGPQGRLEAWLRIAPRRSRLIKAAGRRCARCLMASRVASTVPWRRC
jgi:GMP synthase (glutamine-hydrolysing)